VELHEFITATLVDIQRGVQAAINLTGQNKVAGVINPAWGGSVGHSHLQKVEFDIAVTGIERMSGQADAGIKVWDAGVAGKAEVSDESSKVSRIKFVVCIIPPTTSVRESRGRDDDD
jgi:hypothetical protein